MKGSNENEKKKKERKQTMATKATIEETALPNCHK